MAWPIKAPWMRATIIAVERDSDLRSKAPGGHNSAAIVQRFWEARGIRSKTISFLYREPFSFFICLVKAVKASNDAEAQGQRSAGKRWPVSKILVSTTSCATLSFVKSLHLFMQCWHNVRLQGLQGMVDCREMPLMWGAETGHAVSWRAVFAL